MKKALKEMIPAVILAFVASFMLYIYEPITTYLANMNDFWFDLQLMIPNISLYFVCLFIVLLAIYAIIYSISRIFKKDIIYKIALAISFVLFIYFYIQGVYLIGNLPVLDGSTIEWETYTNDTIISIAIIIILSVSEIILIKKANIDKAIKINKYLTVIVFIMILTSVVSNLANPEIYKEKSIAIATTRNLNNASSNKNFYIFLVDAVDSYDFNKIVKESGEDLTTFEDFTYYPDTVSGYTFTRDSIPFIFSGIWNQNETRFDEYSTKALNESKFINELKNKNYDMNLYESEIIWNDRNAASFSNIDIYNDKVDQFQFFKEFTKYNLFKYLPYPLKKYSHIETASFDSCKIDEEATFFDWGNGAAYENLKNNDIEKIDKNYFQFLHIEGGHVPFNYDEDVNVIPTEEGNYEKKLKATLKIIKTFINRLKESDVYDNSTIVIMADHGFWNRTKIRHNPILYIKGINEHHKMETSDISVSYVDLCDAFVDLLNDKETKDIFQNIDKDRIRKFIDNPAGGEDLMTEYEQKGKAWDPSAMEKTGKEFKR